MASEVIRIARPADAAAMVTIYAPHIIDSHTSFEESVPSAAEFAERFADPEGLHPWLVLEVDGVVAGYAYGGALRGRAAYRWTIEVSIYLDPAFQGRGLARRLYAKLFDLLRAQGYCNAFAGVALPNDASVAFHLGCGFKTVGTYEKIGYKNGQWVDVAWYGMRLQDPEGEASEPVAVRDLTAEARAILSL